MPRFVPIYSAGAQYQHFQTLQRRREKRHRSREFIVEGVRHINLAIEHGWPINGLIYTRDAPLSDWAEAILASGRADAHFELRGELLADLSAKEHPSELMALIGMRNERLNSIPTPRDLLLVVFDRPASPGNLGTLIRSADALGAHGIVITGHAVDLYDPETIAATTGSLFALPAVRLDSHVDLLRWLDKVSQLLPDLQLVGTDEAGETAIDDHDLTKPTVLLVGNETWGLSATYRSVADTLLRIPIGGAASSLNAAVAGSIALYEIGRQRREPRQLTIDD